MAQSSTPWRALLQDLTRLDRSRMSVTMALRNAIGVLLPVIAGQALGQTTAGVIAGVGGLLTSYSDGSDPYRLRARRLFATAVFCACAVGLGTIAANAPPVASVLAAGWAFSAGLCAALGATAADLGIFSLVMFLVECTTPLPLRQSAELAGLSLVGGLLQMTLALVLWPLRRYQPERRELGRLFAVFESEATSPGFSTGAPAMTAEMNRAQAMLTSLTSDRSQEGLRYRSLVNQAERIRLRLISLVHARRRLPEGKETQLIDSFRKEAVNAFHLISRALLAEEIAGPPQTVLAAIQNICDEMRTVAAHETPLLAAAAKHTQFQMNALAGQLRAALDLAQGLSEPGRLVQYRRDIEQPWTLRLTSAWATLRANLTPRSTMFRHAMRLAAGVGIGELVSRSTIGADWTLSWSHTHRFWLPMTVAIVLKPGFVSTMTRGTLRVLGTLVGLALTTAMFAVFHPSVEAQIALIGVLTFVLRWLGVANYGFFAAAVGGLIVLLASVAGADPQPLIAARAMYTAAGGVIAVILYVAWPAPGEDQAGEAVARLLEAYRGYFVLVTNKYRGIETAEAGVDRARLETRTARSNAEAAIDALGGEPTAASRRTLYTAAGAASNRFIHAAMMLDASDEEVIRDDAFDRYCADVVRTLSLLIRVLRGASPPVSEFPDLRKSYELWAKSSGDSRPLLLSEIDRMTNSINTLSERIAILKRAGTA
jgi:uncharacterized membrane protein YccC